MKYLLLSATCAVFTFVVGAAGAEEKKVITLPTTTVYGHPQRPAAAVEVSKVKMTLGATTPTLAAATKIHDASKKDPF